MVLIFSTENDYSTNDVIAWLRYFGKEVIRINIDERPIDFKLTTLINGTENQVFLKYKGYCIDFEKVESFWYRRGGYFDMIDIEQLLHFLKHDKRLTKNIYQNLNIESKALSTYLNFCLTEKKKSLGNIKFASSNKVESIKVAANCGFLVPKTLITDNKKELEEFKKTCDDGVITKASGEGLNFYCNDYFYSVYTEEIKNTDNFPNHFFPSLFQEKLKKLFEIRIFYLDKKCYSMAIFSQKNKKTEVDFRKYDELKPNRNVPFKLPKNIEHKVSEFMKERHLTTGSIDLVYSRKNEFVFLEVNPVGQFAMVSYPCNYNLERLISNYLI